MTKYRAIILSEEISTSEVLKLYISEFDNVDIFECRNMEEVSIYLKNRDKDTFIFIDISNEKQSKLEFISKISSEYKKCKIAALSDSPSVNLIIEIMRSGAKEFLPLPLLKNEFTQVFNKLISESAINKNTNNCKIISVFSNKGGIGKTSLATNLALDLAKITKENVALIDLNFQMGDITTFLDLRPSLNISYMLENIDKINETFLLSTLERYHRTSLYVLADPPYFKQADSITPNQITKLFNTLKDTFSYIIIDAESSFNAKNISALDNSDLILLVTVANLPALRNTQRCLELFEKLGYNKDKTQIIINRYIENDEIKEEDVKKVLSRDVYWKIPNNYFAQMSAINKGVPVSELNSSSDISQSYKELAKHISDNLYKLNMKEKFEDLL